MGLIKLETFLDAQKCSWIKRAHFKCIDNWRLDLKLLSPTGDLTKIRQSDVDSRIHPVLNTIVKSFEKLVASHAKKNGNYKMAYIF